MTYKRLSCPPVPAHPTIFVHGHGAYLRARQIDVSSAGDDEDSASCSTSGTGKVK